ncbi:ATP-binding protein [Silvibacterium acidisoli]|uniref:ATP-binding protein n=1 Tax=Acidobacteriaceae bacterium ZG23-2 TaxID=2883246 RepID=UPI00406C7F7B
MATPRFQGDRHKVLFMVAALIAVIAFADWQINREVPVGFLYLLPIVLASRVLTRLQTALLGIGCTFLAETFDGYQWTLLSGAPRDLLYATAFTGIGLFAYEISAGRRAAVSHVSQLENEIRARREVEEQLEILVESSPVAIITVDEQGSVLLANDAAHRLFELQQGNLIGHTIRPFMPSLVNIPDLRTGQQSFRTVMQCKGRRQNGEIFIADVWFSTYRTNAGPRLAAMIVDTSEDLRDREEAGLHQLLTGSRILIGAVSHEIRNICGAIALVHENLSRSGILAQNQDFEALGTLVIALERIAAMELRQTKNEATTVELLSFLDELRIVIGPSLREDDIEADWIIPSALPVVWADPHSLMQVFLNLTKNAQRALANRRDARIQVVAVAEPQRVLITISDNGDGVSNPELLFKPFQAKATAAGMGLYLSRALMRSFGGDLRYLPGNGASFTVEIASIVDTDERSHGREGQAAAGR